MHPFHNGLSGRRTLMYLLLLFLIFPNVRGVGKDDLQVTVEMEKVVVPEQKGTISVTYKNVGANKLSFGGIRLTSSALTMQNPIIEFELQPGEEKSDSVPFTVKSEARGKSTLYVGIRFCTEIPAGTPPCPEYQKDMQIEFTVAESTPPPPTTALPPAKRLQVTIVSPQQNASFTTEDTLVFEAQPSIGGQIFYVWESNIDGLLGQAQRVERVLSEGTHTIRLIAKSGTQTAEATLAVTVTGVQASETPPPESETPAPEQEPPSRMTSFIIFSAVLALAALAMIGFLVFRPKKKKKRGRIGRNVTLNICPSCGRNNISTAARCWKCKAPLR